MANVDPLDRQEIVQATLVKAFEKLAKKGVIPAEKASALRMQLVEARAELLASEQRRLQVEQDQLAEERQRLLAATRRQ